MLAAGCISGPTDTFTPYHAPTPAAVVSAKPIDIDQVVDLKTGVDGQSWDFTVVGGFKDAVIDVTLRGSNGEPLHGPNDPCVSYKVEDKGDGYDSSSSGSAGNCASGGSNISIGGGTNVSPNSMLHFEGGDVSAGSWHLGLSSQATVGEAVVAVHVHY